MRPLFPTGTPHYPSSQQARDSLSSPQARDSLSSLQAHDAVSRLGWFAGCVEKRLSVTRTFLSEMLAVGITMIISLSCDLIEST